MRKISTLFSGLFLIVLLFGFQKTDAQLIDNGEIIVDSVIFPDGRIAVKVIVPGIPPKDYKAPIAYPTKASTILPSVPAFNWSFGCSATSAAMIAGHYDNMGYPNMYAGPTNGGAMPMDNSAWSDVYINGEWRHQCPLSATRDGVDGRTTFGHVDDYWVSNESTSPDPYIGNWTQHTYGECTGDYMKTNQSAFGNIDGSTGFWFWTNNTPMTAADLVANGWDDEDGGYGFKLFFESRGYTVTSMFNQRRYGYNGVNAGFTYSDFMAEIDAGHLVLIQVTNHTMVGYGYDDGGGTNTVYIHDTWDYNDHTMTWAGSYGGLAHRGVTIVELASSNINVWTGNVNHYWSNSGNWSLGHIPLGTEDVEIPNINTPCYVDVYDASCHDLLIYSGATLEIRDQILTVNNDLAVHGTIEMAQENAYLNVMHDISWESGSSLDVLNNSTFIQIWGDWNFKNGANVNPTQGFVDFEGTASSYIRCYDDNCSFNTVRFYRTVGLSGLSTEDLVINGLTYINSAGAFNNYSDENIWLRGNLNYYGTFDLTGIGSTVYFDGTSQGINKYSTNDGVFNNVTFSSSTGTTITSGGLTAEGNIVINQGFFAPGTDPVYVGGNWYNYVGTAGFAEGTSRVIFNGGDYHQYCSNETFNVLEINKPSGGAFRINGANVECAAYDWTAGAVDVLSGSFTANDLLDDGIYGAFFLNSGGTINLANYGGNIDLSGELHIFGGTMNVYGGGSYPSYWPFVNDAVIEMDDGILDFHDKGIYINYLNPALNLTVDITGGVIRTSEGFQGNRPDFTPTAGTFEFYGTSDYSISQTNNCTLFNVLINKYAKNGDQSINDKSIQDVIFNPENNNSKISNNNQRSKIDIISGGKSNTITLASDFTITGTLNINAGSLTLAGHELTVAHDCNVYGTLNMTNASDIINVGATYAHGLYFNSGSTGNLTQGVANIYGWFQTDAGCSVNPSLSHTVIFKGVSGGGPNNYEPAATYGNIEIFKDAGHRTYIHAQATQPIVVDGNFTVHPNNEFELQNETMIVHGLFTDNNTSEIYIYNAAKKGSTNLSKGIVFGQTQIAQGSPVVINDPSDEKGAKAGYLEIDSDFLLTGLMDVGDGEVIIHGNFDQPASGSLIINGGSLISDAPLASISYYAGTFNMTDGTLEITNNPMNFYPSSSTISGGTIRCGGYFISNISGSLQPTGGLVELIGTGGTANDIQIHADNYFYDLTINRTNTIQIEAGYDLNIKNDFTILSGGLNTNGGDMYVGGNWDNQVGPSAFIEGSGKVVFNGPGPSMQFFYSDETFNSIENNTVEAIRIQGSYTVECNSYTWLSGGVSVYLGTFIANDLSQGGIYGNWFALSGSEIHLYQDAQLLDMFGDRFFINGGLIRIYGGLDVSYWCSSSALDVDITSGGVLDFVDIGINIWETQPLTYDLSDGTIKAGGHFTCRRTDFHPTGSTFEFHGGADSYINVYPGSDLDNVIINKSGGDKSLFEYKDRNGNVIESTKTNMAYLSNDLEIEGELIVDEGTLSLNANTLNCYGDININNGGILNVNDNSVLALDYLSYLHANSGGTLNLLGSSGNEATITHVSSSLYSLWIENGGTISAEHALFEYMAYVYLRPGSLVDPVHSFHYCTFQNGSAGFPLMVFYNTQTLQVNNAVFPTNTWGGPYNVQNINTGDVTFYNATGGFAGPEFENDVYNTIHWTMTPYEVDLEVFLEGPFNNSTSKMDYTLNDLGILPLSQPFDTNPLADWYYTGTESVGSIPDFAVDWVLVELRDAPNVAGALPGRVIARQAGFILNNGEVVGLDGLNPLDFDAAVYDNLYVNIWHRNHLGVISANPLVNVGGTYSYNFFSGSGQAYGGTAAQKQLSPGMWGILSGDGNGNGLIGQPDKVNIWNIQTGESGYKAGDFNLDGQINNQDKNDQWIPNFGAGSFIPE